MTTLSQRKMAGLGDTSQSQRPMNVVVGLLLLCPLFFVQIAIGGVEYPVYSFALTIGLALLLFVSGRKIRLSLVLWGLTFAAISLSNRIETVPQFLLALKFLIFLSPAFLLPAILRREEFDELLYRSSKFCLVISTLAFGLGQVTGTQLAADLGYGFSRMQGFASEPSSLALPVALVLVRGLMKRNWNDLLIACIAAVLSMSLIVFIVCTLTIAAYLFFRTGWLVRIAMLLLAVISLWFGLELATRLGEIGESVSLVSRLSDGLMYLFSGGESGYNPRLDKAEFFERYLNIFGNGLNTYDGEELRDWNIHFEVLYAFGVAGWAFFMASSIAVAWRLYRRSLAAFMQFTSTYIYVSLNSGQGITLSLIVYAYFMYVLTDVRLRRPAELMRDSRVFEQKLVSGSI